MPERIEQHQPGRDRRDVVLVTGASGFIGSAVIRRLAERYTVVGLDRDGPADSPDGAVTIEFDLGAEESVRTAIAEVRERFGERIASVIHLAAYYDVSGKPNPLYREVTVEGTRRLIDALQDFEVEQFVYASTMLVHRPTESPDQRIDEESPIDPLWAYPESKAETEALLRERHGDIPVVLLRIAGVYDDMGHSAFLAEQISRIYEHRATAHLYPGMLCAAQSSIHLDDLTDVIARLVERRETLPDVLPLLVGEPDALGYAETQDIIGQTLHGEDWTTVRIPQPVAAAGSWLQNEALEDQSFIKPWMVEQSDAHYILDISRARELLDWSPKHSLREALPGIVEALKADPTGWYKANKLNPSLVAWYGHTPARHVDEGAANRDRSGPSSHEGHAMAGDEHDRHGHMAMMERDEARKRWTHFATIGLGLWLASSPLIFGIVDADSVTSRVAAVTAERGLAPIAWRSMALAWSDVVTGLLIALFGILSLSKRTAWFGQWASCFAGLWLLFAPLVFWAPTAPSIRTTCSSARW